MKNPMFPNYPRPETETSHNESAARQHQLENQLRAAESKYKELYEFAPIGYFDLDVNNNIINVNLSGARMLGLPRIRLLGKRFSIFVNKESLPIFKTHIKKVFTAQIKQHFELELIRDNGTSFYAELQSILVIDPLHNSPYVHLTLVDIGERRQTEQALRASEEKFRSIIETTKEWIWGINLKGQFLYSNPAVKNILGYSINELLNSTRFLLVHKDDRALVTKALLQAVKSKQGWNDLIIRWRCKDGSYRYLESNSIPCLNNGGKVIGFRGADRDITLRKQAEEQARQHQAALNQTSRMNSLGELASTLAHELTQPLTAVNNYIAGSIKKMCKTNDHDVSVLEALREACLQAERAGQIIHRMKDFAQRGKLFLEKVNINDIIYESIALIKNEFPFSPVRIHFEPIGGQFLITADRVQLVQVLLNLMRNSIEAMTDDCTHNPELHIKYCRQSNYTMRVSVSDNGPGICDINGDGLDKVFKACFTTKSKGLGLGLSISQTLIETHHGQLIAGKNPKNKGANFQFILPIDPGYKATQDFTLFIIDDDVAVCNSLRWLFASIGLSVEAYNTASDYLEVHNPIRRGCLLIDIHLTGMNGFELQKKLVEQQNPIPIIMITGHGDVNLAVRAMKAGAKDFILKPFNNELLLEKIQRIIAENFPYYESDTTTTGEVNTQGPLADQLR